jgi:hypothetical protein
MQPAQQLDEHARTKNWVDLNTRWEQRTKLAAEWLQNDCVVADIGCGLMTLEAYLPSATKYLPMDLVPRDSRTLVFDINHSPIPTVSCDVAVMLGVLEYTDNVALVLQQLQQFPRCVISYNHVSLNDFLWKIGLRRKRVNWRQRYTRANFRRLLMSSGLQVIRERKIRLGERLYEVRPAAQRAYRIH